MRNLLLVIVLAFIVAFTPLYILLGLVIVLIGIAYYTGKRYPDSVRSIDLGETKVLKINNKWRVFRMSDPLEEKEYEELVKNIKNVI